MKLISLKKRKVALLALSLGCSISAPCLKAADDTLAEESSYSQEQIAVFKKIHERILFITATSIKLVRSFDDPASKECLNGIYEKLQSVRGALTELKKDIEDAITDNNLPTEVCTSLKLELVLINKVDSLLNRFSTIIRDGLNRAKKAKGKRGCAFAFGMYVKQPLKELASPEELQPLEKELAILLPLVKKAHNESAQAIESLQMLIKSIGKLTQSKISVTEALNKIEAKIPVTFKDLEAMHITPLDEWAKTIIA